MVALMTPKGRNRLIHDDDRLFMARGVIRIVWKKMYYEVRNWLETTSFVPRCCRETSITPGDILVVCAKQL